ncbi:unnamed protein product [Medioppia subpectinata]|uniref:Uncharacterized protein n=1 Tax=Medioppia subpectinata TaxID=1979941 RepID=A0A7R9KVD4_9ACAR|nr:unnamed protein product [Medioppia subpectinata]CAG2110177.1 unnamed protein product [Medioppia subpectinata]
MTDVFDDLLLDPLYVNINLISEAIARQLYKDFEPKNIGSDLKVSQTNIKSLLNQLSRQSRAQQSLLSTRKGTQVEASPLIRNLEQIMRKYVNDVQLIHIKVDNKDNELVFYEPTSALYSNSKTQPKVNLLFLLSSAGKFNYFGTKKWIDQQLDGNEGSLLTDSLFTICLDSLADRDRNSGLFMHVSKPPKEGTPAAQLFHDLKQIASTSLTHPFNVSMIHKKINLAEEVLAWEHERFSIRRLSAFTLSALLSHKSLRRNSMTDVFDDSLLDPLYVNINLISEAIARQLYKDFEPKNIGSDLKKRVCL